jgi:hypothetical protein
MAAFLGVREERYPRQRPSAERAPRSLTPRKKKYILESKRSKRSKRSTLR